MHAVFGFQSGQDECIDRISWPRARDDDPACISTVGL